MSGGIQIRTRSLAELLPIFDRLLRRAEDLSPLMERIGVYLESSTDRRFEQERDPRGRFWKRSRRAREEGGKTLTDTARGRQSITSNAARDQVEIGTNVGYMAAHQKGAVIRPRSAAALAFTLPGLGLVFAKQVILPKREFLGVSKVDEDEIVGLGEDYFEEVSGGAA